MSRYKSIVSLLFALIVSLATATGLIAAVIINGVCNPDVLSQCVNESDYYDDKLALVTDKLTQRLEASGLPADIAGEVISAGNINVDMNSVVSNKLAGNTGYIPDTGQFEKTLNDSILSYYQSNGVTPGDELERITQVFVSEAAREYASLLDYEYADYFKVYSEKYSEICHNVIYICIVVIIISLVMLVLIHRRKYRGIRYINYGLISGTILAIMLNVLLKNRLTDLISDNSVLGSGIIEQYIAVSFSQGLYTCLFGVLISIIMMCITLYMRKEAI